MEQDWSLWEVFIQPKDGEAHQHFGSIHASDEENAIQNARDVFTRRGEGISIWVVESKNIFASSPSEKGPFFDPGNDKAYRHPKFYTVPKVKRNE